LTQNTTKTNFFVDVLISDRDRNVNKKVSFGCVLGQIYY